MDPVLEGFGTLIEPHDRHGHGAAPLGGIRRVARVMDPLPEPGLGDPGHGDRQQRHGASNGGAGRRRKVPMSFRELARIDVKEVLRRWQAGQSARQMAREGVVSRRTAAR